MTVAPARIDDVQTPALLLDRDRLDANIARMRAALPRDVALRMHLKTAKSVDVARRVAGAGPIAVSTLREAEVFADAGFIDMLYAVGIAPAKLERVIALRRRGVDLTIVVDSIDAARAVSATDAAIPTLIEIDADGQRAGVAPDDAGQIVAIARMLSTGGAGPRGVMVHAGGSYGARSHAEIASVATDESAAALTAARTLRDAGFAAPLVSIGSTPTALAAVDLTGIGEVRAGVFMFFDLVMTGLGVCGIDDIALSVLATVIGHQSAKGWILVDAGWMAMSRDRGTAAQRVDQGYGLVCDAGGRPYTDLIMTAANQEHGILAIRAGSDAALPALGVGAQVRILPNHACATAAQHQRYHVVTGSAAELVGEWERFGGW